MNNERNNDDRRFKGTTTIGIKCRDGVILGSEKRVTLGFTRFAKEKKTYKIDDNVWITGAGASADLLKVAQILTIEYKLFKTRNGRKMTIKSMSSLFSNILYQQKMFPFLVVTILGGVEEDGTPIIYAFDAYGAGSVDNYFSHGSGMQSALAILDDGYKETSTVKENIPLAIKAINAAMDRDIFSGDAIELIVITKSGYKEYSEEDTKKILEKEKEERKK